jgi:ribosome-associated toxin RatA of RatAB toxin-antitoxin module
MKISVKQELPYSAEDVFTAFRDRMLDYIKFCPNITKVVIMSREDVDENTTKMRVQWHGLGQIPDVIRAILKPEMISWEDWEEWDKSALECRWTIKPYYFREFVKSEGVWKFEPRGDSKCAASCTGIFNVNITHFPPFPSFICRSASPLIEKMIGSYVQPNLKSVFGAVGKFIADERKKKSK